MAGTVSPPAKSAFPQKPCSVLSIVLNTSVRLQSLKYYTLQGHSSSGDEWETKGAPTVHVLSLSFQSQDGVPGIKTKDWLCQILYLSIKYGEWEGWSCTCRTTESTVNTDATQMQLAVRVCNGLWKYLRWLVRPADGDAERLAGRQAGRQRTKLTGRHKDLSDNFAEKWLTRLHCGIHVLDWR